MGFIPCDARVLAGLPDSTLDLFTKQSLFTITKDNNISEKSRVTRKNCLCSQLNAEEKLDTMGPLKLLRHLEVIIFYFIFTENWEIYVFSSKTF